MPAYRPHRHGRRRRDRDEATDNFISDEAIRDEAKHCSVEKSSRIRIGNQASTRRLYNFSGWLNLLVIG